MNRQLQLPFEPSREQARRQRVEHLLSDEPRLTTAVKLFDYAEATAAAANHHPPNGSF